MSFSDVRGVIFVRFCPGSGQTGGSRIFLYQTKSSNFHNPPIITQTLGRLKSTLSDKRRMSFNVAMHYPVITVYFAVGNKH